MNDDPAPVASISDDLNGYTFDDTEIGTILVKDEADPSTSKTLTDLTSNKHLIRALKRRRSLTPTCKSYSMA